jgi:pimeloyl-ACP methyl ester carboxylesterase
MGRLSAVCVLVAALAGAGCSGSGGAPGAKAGPSRAPQCTASEAGHTAPADSFYENPPRLTGRKPGDVLKCVAVLAPKGYRAWTVLYASTGVAGGLVPVSAIMLVRDGPAPANGRPILSWAHGTTGIADCAAPSRYGVDQALLSGYSQRPYTDTLLRRFLDRGYLVVATDYEGLGTPGVHPYLVGTSEGRSVLDAARAAQRFQPVRGSGPVVLAGHSQGGHAALWAGQIAPEYAPDLDLRGVLAFAPATDLTSIADASLAALRTGNVTTTAGTLALVVAAWQQIYHLKFPSPPFAPELADSVDSLVSTCQLTPPTSSGTWVTGDAIPAEWTAAIRKNTPGPRFQVPLLVVQGDSDEQIPYDTTAAAVRRYRAAGTSVTLVTIPHADHLAAVSRADVTCLLAWTDDPHRGSKACR